LWRALPLVQSPDIENILSMQRARRFGQGVPYFFIAKEVFVICTYTIHGRSRTEIYSWPYKVSHSINRVNEYILLFLCCEKIVFIVSYLTDFPFLQCRLNFDMCVSAWWYSICQQWDHLLLFFGKYGFRKVSLNNDTKKVGTGRQQCKIQLLL